MGTPCRTRKRLEACCTPGRARIVHFTPPATQRASLSRSGDLTVASFIKIIDSGHQDSQYLATLTFDTTAGAAQDECPASPSPTVVGWMATRMAATPTTVARWMPVPIAVPLAAVGARGKVAPHCVTASAPTPAAELPLVQTCVYLFSRTAGTHGKLSTAAHSSHCGECAAVRSVRRRQAVREKRYAQVFIHPPSCLLRCIADCVTWQTTCDVVKSKENHK